MRCSLIVFFLLCISLVESSAESSNATEGIQLAQWRFHHLQFYLTITIFIFCIILVKTIYEYLEVISSVIPESCILIMIGTIFGVVLKYGLRINTQHGVWQLTPDLFLLVLLPPIVLEAAHDLSQRAFTDIFGPVMLFAAVGTALSFLIIGFSLYGLNIAGAMGADAPGMSISHCLLFGSLIVAVDPVAVLAIFEEIGVDKTLYFLVFGESLFNDAITIVLYNMMVAFVRMKTVGTVDIVLGISSFLTVSLGGAAVGLVFGIISCLLTRCSTHSRLIQPLVIVTVAYLSYLAGDLVGWSGIISMIACGILQSSYAFHNMSAKSVSVTRRILKMWAKLNESIIFLYLGIELTNGILKWSTGFCLWSLVLCLLARFFVTFLLSFILNKTNSIITYISFTQQFIIGYGGLRGAVAFSLATMIKDEVFISSDLTKEHFVAAAMFIIIFTIFPMGITIKPLVKLLHIRLEESKTLSLIDEINENVVDHFTAGIESVAGSRGRNAFREWMDHIDEKYIRPLLQNRPESHSQRIVDVYEKVALTLHYAAVDHNHKSAKYLDKLCQPLRERFIHESQCRASLYEDHHHDQEDECREDSHKKGFIHGVGAVTSIIEAHHQEEQRQPKCALAISRRLNIVPEVRSDDYAGIIKYSKNRHNAIMTAAIHETEHDAYLGRMHAALKRKKRMLIHVFRRNHNRQIREMQQCTSKCCLSSVNGLTFRRFSDEDLDTCKHSSNSPHVAIQMPKSKDVHFYICDEDDNEAEKGERKGGQVEVEKSVGTKSRNPENVHFVDEDIQISKL